MIAFVAFGSGSIADALNLGGDAIVNLIPANFTSISQQQIIEIDDASFKPVQLITHVVENKTSNQTDNNSTNSTNVTTPIT